MASKGVMMKNLNGTSQNISLQLFLVALLAFQWIGTLKVGYFFEASYFILDLGLYLLVAYGAWRGLFRINIWHCALFLFTMLYFFSCLYAQNPITSLHEASRYAVMFPIALIASTLSEDRRQILFRQWPWMGTFLVISGWSMELFRESRLESTLEYANTLAIVLLCGCWIAWRTLKEHARNIYIIPLIVQLVGLLQTGSRAVLVLASLVLILEILTLKGKRRVIALILLGTGLVTCALLAFIMKVPVFVRLTQISWNTSEFMTRRIYWHDSLVILKQHWLGGLGAGGWQYSHPSWYYVKYVHNFFLQTAIEVGVFGVVLFTAIVLIPFLHARRNLKSLITYSVPIALLLVHSAFDIDFVFPLCLGLFVLLLNQIESGRPYYETRPSGLFVRLLLILTCSLIIFIILGIAVLGHYI